MSRDHLTAEQDEPRVAPESAPTPAPTAARTRQQRVLALQRSHGNAAVNRLLARAPDDLLDAEPLGVPVKLPAKDDGGGSPAPSGPVRIDREDVIISTASGPTLSAAGGYDWRVTYALPFAAEADGWMIQNLYMEGSGGTPGEHFWECWKVRSGNRAPEDRGEDAYDDRYVFGNVPGALQAASGWKRHVGVIRFYPGPLPSQFGAETPGKNFYHTHEQPSGWTGKGTRHDAYSEWDTKRQPPLNGFVGYAGTTELRRGDPVKFRPRAQP